MNEIEAKTWYDAQAKDRVSCGLCGAGDPYARYTGDRYGMGLQTALCGSCGLIYVDPRPVPDAMRRFYEDHYRDFYESAERPTQAYLEAGVHTQRAGDLVTLIDTEHTFPSTAFRVLDVGCAEGSALRQVRDRWPETTRVGIEPSPTFGDFAKSYADAEVYAGELDDFMSSHADDIGAFQLVIASHVLEHCADPRAALRAIRSLMSDDGLFYVEVPNVIHPSCAGLGHFHLAHLYMFVPRSLEAMLRAEGFAWIASRHEGLADEWAMGYLCRKAEPEQPAPASADEIREIERALNPPRPAAAPAAGVRGFLRRIVGSS